MTSRLYIFYSITIRQSVNLKSSVNADMIRRLTMASFPRNCLSFFLYASLTYYLCFCLLHDVFSSVYAISNLSSASDCKDSSEFESEKHAVVNITIFNDVDQTATGDVEILWVPDKCFPDEGWIPFNHMQTFECHRPLCRSHHFVFEIALPSFPYFAIVACWMNSTFTNSTLMTC